MIRTKTIFHIIREFDLIHEAKRQEHDDYLVRLLMRDYKYQKPIK